MERLGHFFSAHNITTKKKRSIILSVIGPTPYKLLRNLVPPDKLTDKPFTRLTGGCGQGGACLLLRLDSVPIQRDCTKVNVTYEGHDTAAMGMVLPYWEEIGFRKFL